MTLVQEKSDVRKMRLRQVEVVEHRSDPNLLFETIRNKMVGYPYDRDTVLVCLVLTPAIYDLKSLSKKLCTINSLIRYVLVIFAGVPFTGLPLTKEQRKASFTIVQLQPEFNEITFDLSSYLKDFKEKYDKGQESWLIEDGNVCCGTVNPKFFKLKNK